METVLFCVVVFGAYFFPTMYAFHRKHRNVFLVFALNFVLGWTVIGWFVAVIWAHTGVRPLQQPAP